MNDTPNLKYTAHSYGEHELQRLGVWLWDYPLGAHNPVLGAPTDDNKTKYWFM
jgi:hypothetical protein